MLKILQVRLLWYLNWELSDVQAVFRKGRGTRAQIANILWIIGKARELPSSEHPGLISFRMDYWISLQSKRLSRVFSNTSVQI